jgi:predicted N-acetyltransferase YhbS
MAIQLRSPTAADADECGRIIFEAFSCVADRHNMPRDFPAPEVALGLTRAFVSHPSVYAVVAEEDGRVVGSNFLDERDAIRGVGPITVDPAHQGRGIGRRLMQAVIDRGRDAAGVRLVQDAFNTVSMSLYTSLGFDPKEPLALMRGKPKSRPGGGAEVRPVREADLDACADLCRRVHGFDRRNELRGALDHFRPHVLLRGGRVAAYCSAPTFWIGNHGVAETERDIRDLLVGVGAACGEPLSLLVPIRQAVLFRWLLSEGLRVLKPMTLMAMGEYHEPRGSYFPSVAY